MNFPIFFIVVVFVIINGKIAYGLKSLKTDFQLDDSDSTDLKTLELVQVIFRHGDRTPTNSYPLDPYRNASEYWPIGLGQLTNVGKLQHYELGRYFRKRYDGFLNEFYVPHEIFVLSSDMDRTIMSAEANLAGLYKPKNSDDNWNPVIPWTPIPIRTIPTMEDKFLRSMKSCPKYHQLFEEAMKSETVEHFNLQHKTFIEYVKNHTGIERAKTLEDIVGVEDVLTVQKYHHYILPSWAAKIWSNFHQIAAEVFSWNTLTPEMKRLKGGPLLKVLLHNMKIHCNTEAKGEWMKYFPHISNHNSSSLELTNFGQEEFIVGRAKKLYMFSAHDSTIMRIMDTLGVYNQIMPPYATAFIVELHKINNEFAVKMFFRNDTKHAPYQLQVPGCETVCNLEKFIKLTKPVVPTNWELECKESRNKLLASARWYDSIKPIQTGKNKHQIDNATKLYILGEALLVVGILLVLIMVILFIGRRTLTHPIVSHNYPFIKSRANNYGIGYESI